MSKLSLPVPQGAVIADQWTLGKPIAVGGFAVVYLATDKDDVDVIVKVLRPDALESDHAAAARFEREAQVAVSFEHPYVVKSLAYGRTENDVPYLVMERLNGETLSGVMYTEPQPEARVRTIAVQILEALEAAHGRGYVHRDLKPSNVYLAKDDNGESVKLLDFGFVKVLETDDPSLQSPLTKMGEAVGTPGYMAPEMLRNGVVTPQNDIYAVGLLAYELLTAEQAYPGEGMQRAMAQVEGDPAPPSDEVRALSIWPAVERMYARNPKKRYQTARDAIDALTGDSGKKKKKRKKWFGIF